MQRPLAVLGKPSRASYVAGALSWQDEVRFAITDAVAAEHFFVLTEAERSGFAQAEQGGFPVSVTPYYASLASSTDPECPIRKQCLPVQAESHVAVHDMTDPLGEVAHEVAPHLVQRYPDRVLLLVTDRCSVYCRFCTRSRMVGQGGGVRSDDKLAPAFKYLEQHPEIRDVIVSGGDPLVMAETKIAAILGRISQIPHIDTVRIASRVPVTLPMRIDATLCQALRKHPSVWLMTHFNHPSELSPLASDAIAQLVDAGINVMNQTVLLRGINDDVATLTELFRGLVKRRARPYYLLQADPVVGTSHLRTPLSVGMHLMQELQGRLSGIALPKFIVDTPGGFGKVQAQATSLVSYVNGVARFRTHHGEVDYFDP